MQVSTYVIPLACVVLSTQNLKASRMRNAASLEALPRWAPTFWHLLREKTSFWFHINQQVESVHISAPLIHFMVATGSHDTNVFTQDVFRSAHRILMACRVTTMGAKWRQRTRCGAQC